MHQIYKSFGDSHEVRSVFLVMPKAFDKVWRNGLTFKLERKGISRNLLSTLTDFLKLKKQRVVLNGPLSSWSNIESDISQSFILGPLFFFYLYKLSFRRPHKRMSGSLLMIVLLFSVVDNIKTSVTNLNSDLSKIIACASQWKMTFNPDPHPKNARRYFFL